MVERGSLAVTRRAAATGGGSSLPPLLQEPALRPLAGTKVHVTFTVSPGLLERFDQFCRENHRKHSFMIYKGMEAVLMGARFQSELKGKEDSKRGLQKRSFNDCSTIETIGRRWQPRSSPRLRPIPGQGSDFPLPSPTLTG